MEPRGSERKISEICSAVLARIQPTEEDRRKSREVINRLMAKLSEGLSRRGIEAEVRVEGSFAKDTWLAGENDLDLFVLLPEDSPRELFTEVLEVAQRLGGKRRLKYAEHPYLEIEFRGYRVEVVPCFRLRSPTELRSAVDRTPFHTQYVSRRLNDGLKREVRLLKRFMMGTGCYGSEFKVGGFSGYLCELLILHYGSFQGLVGRAASWKPGIIIDIEGVYADPSEVRLLFGDRPLVVVDPVDRSRNVAAAVSLQSFATFVLACRDFLKEPHEKFFFPNPARKISRRELSRLIERRGTGLFCITFKTPDVVEDVLYPQLRKTERTISAALAREGFEVLRSDVWSDGISVILLEVAHSCLPGLRMRVGPPITVSASNFIGRHLHSGKSWSGPYVNSEGRVVFEVEREKRRVGDVLRQLLDRREGFGKHVKEAVSEGYRVYEGKGVLRLCRYEGVATFLSEYLTRCLPWYR